MKYVLIIHVVNDYKFWKDGFDEAASLRKKAGEIEYKVLRYEDNSNCDVHFSKWETHGKAKLFFESQEITDLRKQLGVEEPKFIYLTESESGLL